MRIKLHKYLRLALIILSIITFAVASVMIYIELKVPKFIEEKMTLYSSNHKTDIKYYVFLKPNILYDKDNLEEGQVYLTELIDYVQANFKYEFVGDENAEITGDYAITAEVEGYTIKEEKTTTIWKKKFPLIPKTGFKSKDKKLVIAKEIPLKLKDYNAFVDQVKEASKVNVPAKLSILMNINLKAATQMGEIVEAFAPQLMIPLGDSQFEITKSGIGEKPGVIEETKKTQLPPDRKKINLYGGILGFGIILLSCLIAFTSNAKVDPFTKKIKGIFKKHGNRLVALNAEVAVTCEAYSEVKSMDDLVRIADELGKPILYQYSEQPKDINQFCVYDDTCTYAYYIKDIPVQEKQSKPKLKKIKEIGVNIDKVKEDETMS